MKKLTSQQLRNMWLKFYELKGHYIVPSGSLIPIEDDSLLWINAGVATLKKYFDGSEKPPSPRLTNAQKSIRTGDIENIGITARHHTFFEMIGNFSIGDYFKNEAIEFAFEILTSSDWFEMPIEKLWITVFEEDQEAIDQWVKVGIPREKIFKMGRNTNFWDMGKGPSGPSTEIFFDRGDKYDSRTAKELIELDLENDRFVEIWNIVFSQFNNDGEGNYTELPQKNIDTGAGLERLASVFQDTPTNFETDLFVPIIKMIEKISNNNYVYDYIPGKLSEKQEKIQRAMKQIADFARTSTFAIGDGVIPSNNGRGYIIRRLLRRAVISGRKLGIKKPFIYKLSPVVSSIMNSFYPQIKDNLEIIQDKIKAEEIQFARTLIKSTELLKKLIVETKEITLPSNKVFELYETHGLPLEFIIELSSESKKSVNKEDFDKLMEDFQNKSRSNQKVGEAMTEQKHVFRGMESTKFIGYETLRGKSKIVGIDGKNISVIQSPFYATSGGQEFDHGTVDGIEVINIYKNGENVIVHELKDKHLFKVGDEVELSVDPIRRESLMRNHSSVHLAFKALEKELNFKVPQVGSKIEDDFFRFDFTYHKNISSDIIIKVEKEVNRWVNQGVNCDVKEMFLAEAKELGATFLEGTKYGKKVRVVNFEGITIDLCGGTHVSNTADIQDFKLLKIEKKGSGVFRVTGTSGQNNVSKTQERLAHQSIQEVKKKIENFKSIVPTKELQIIINNALDSLKHKPAQQVLNKAKLELDKLNEELRIILKEKFNKFENMSIIEVNEVEKKALSNSIKSLSAKLINEIVLVKNFNDNITNVAFILGKEVKQNYVASLLREVLNSYENIKGGGARQVYQYGGPSSEIELFITEAIKKING